MRRTPFLLVGLLLMVIGAGRGLQPRDVPGVQRGTLAWYGTPAGIASTEYSDVEAQLYRFDIKPMTPESGISTGYVIAYGHPLKRPYRFEIRDDTLLLLNGVQVYPLFRKPETLSVDSARAAQVWQGDWTKDELDHMMAIVSSCEEIFRRHSAIGPSSYAAIADSIRTALKHRGDVVCAEVHGGTANVSFTFRVRPARKDAPDLQSPLVVLPTPLVTAPVSWASDTISARDLRRGTLETLARQDSSWLVRGGLLLYGPLTGGNYNGRYFGAILRIAISDSTTWGQKAASLHALRILPVFRQVKELMYNFVRAEYLAVLEER